MRIELTSISARGNGEELDVAFVFDTPGMDRERAVFTISSRQYLSLSLMRGETDEETADAVEHASNVWAATKKGILLLGYGAVSPKAMRTKLISKGFDKTVAEEAAEELVAMGLIVPDSDASALARRCVAKLWGRKRIAAELYEKGYSSNAVDAAMAYLEDSQIDFAGNCRALIEKRYDTLPSDITERKRLYAALCRYGYSSSEIKQAMEGMRPDR